MGTPKTKRTSNGVFDFVDDFLWQEILARLPVKSIGRSKCVSKRWLSLLSHPYFVQNHLQYFHSNGDDEDDDKYVITLLLVNTIATMVFPKCLDYPKPPFHLKGFSFDFIPVHHLRKKRRFEFLTVSNGWVLCRTGNRSRSHTPLTYEVHYHVCNPLTQQWLDIPVPPQIQTNNGERSFPVVGFTCDEEDNFKPVQFKITEFLFTFDRITRTRLHVRTFSSQTWQWSVTSTIPCPQTPHHSQILLKWSTGIICRYGILHYATSNYVFAVNPNFGDDVTRALQFIPLPDGNNFRNPCKRINLGTCDGHIHLIQMQDQADGSAVFLSVSKLINDSRDPTHKPYSWGLLRTMKIHITAVLAEIGIGDGMVGFYCCSNGMVEVLGLSPLDSDIVYLRFGNCIGLANLKSKTLKKITEMKIDDKKFMSFVPFVLPYWKLLIQNSQTHFISEASTSNNP